LPDHVFISYLIHLTSGAQGNSPALKASGNWAIADVLQPLGRIGLPGLGRYSASKSVAWSLADEWHEELRAQGTRAAGVQVACQDTGLAKALPALKRHTCRC
jgi:hypothetical protein